MEAEGTRELRRANRKTEAAFKNGRSCLWQSACDRPDRRRSQIIPSDGDRDIVGLRCDRRRTNADFLRQGHSVYLEAQFFLTASCCSSGALVLQNQTQ